MSEYSNMAPTAQDLFGPEPWITTAGGTGPNGSYGYNPYYFATPATAAIVAKWLGGTVVAQDAITMYGPFRQNCPNQMIAMPDGTFINAGLIAGLYDHGYAQETVEQEISQAVGADYFATIKTNLPRVVIPPPLPPPPIPIVAYVYQIGDVMDSPPGDPWPVGHVLTDEATGAQYEKKIARNPFAASRVVYYYQRIA